MLESLCQKGGFDASKRMNTGNQNLAHPLFWVIRIEICPALSIEPLFIGRLFYSRCIARPIGAEQGENTALIHFEIYTL